MKQQKIASTINCGEGARKREFTERLNRFYDELKWLYMELYPGQTAAFEDLCASLYQYYLEREEDLKDSDRRRSADPLWYKGNDMLGMMLYADAFAGNLKGVEEKLPYIKECGVNYIHLMPLLDCPEKNNDGGYAVSDFRRVRPDLGTMDDLKHLASECHGNGISLCLDFVMNHTSEEHEWAKRARSGEKEYQDRYFFYDDSSIPEQFERTVPQVFPTTAPGNFTFDPVSQKVVMTTFYPYQWDLNYANPVVFTEMVGNMLNLVNQGIDIIRLDAVPYIWKQLGTNCRNLPQVHNLVRMMRIISDIVCPGVLLLGEVVMEPDKVVPYFGTVEKPECHMLYNVTTMASIWHTVATRDARLLRHQMDIMNALPKEYVFLNYLRCHDDIGWGLDYPCLRQFGMEEVPHKKFLNDFFQGKFEGSFARGELYNDSEELGDARLCGTTASLCGVEQARRAVTGMDSDENLLAGSERKENMLCEDKPVAKSQNLNVLSGDAKKECKQNENKDEEKTLALAIRYDLTLHAFMLAQSGIPVIYSGDEIGQENDYGYHQDPKKCEDSRYIHRGDFRWDLEKEREAEGSVPQQIFDGLRKLEQLRNSHAVFEAGADVWTVDTWDDSILGIIRSRGEEKLVTLYNFSEQDRVAWINEDDGIYRDLISGRRMEARGVQMPAFGCCWLLRE
ncbi:MAG: alpha-amylase family protein [Clostridiales bacterium]|nr:alpha-amylase family protein [Clostridiales bacterium]